MISITNSGGEILKAIYDYVGTFEFYDMSNYFWVMLGVFLLIYATNVSSCNLYKVLLFYHGILYCTFLGAIANIEVRLSLIFTIISWIIIEVLTTQKKQIFVMLGLFIILNRFILRVLLYFDCSMMMKPFYLLIAVILSMILSLVFIKKSRCFHNENSQANIFIFLPADILASGLCEIVWKQSDGAWKFFHGEMAPYEYYVYMSKIEIRQFHILLFYFIVFFIMYGIGVKILKIREKDGHPSSVG